MGGFEQTVAMFHFHHHPAQHAENAVEIGFHFAVQDAASH
jgi:hypothetical protein